jgi:hypothetical protein
MAVLVRHVVDHPDRGGGGRRDEARSQVAGLVPEVLGDPLGDQLGELAHEVLRVCGERLVLAHQALAQPLLPQALGPELPLRAGDAGPQGVDRVGARLALAQPGGDHGVARLEVVEDDVVLRREVGEEGPRRDLGRVGYVGDGRAVESALAEELERRLDDPLSRPLLLAFPQSRGRLHCLSDHTRSMCI